MGVKMESHLSSSCRKVAEQFCYWRLPSIPLPPSLSHLHIPHRCRLMWKEAAAYS